MTSTRSTRLLAAAALALAATACAGSTGPDPIAERELEEFQNTTTAAPATTTDAAPQTAATTQPPVTEAPTTLPTVPATEAPTTTSAEPADPRTADLVAALDAHTAAWRDCVGALPQCDPNSLADRRSGELLKSSSDIIIAGNTNGWTTTNLESYRTTLESVKFISDEMANVTSCNEDGIVVHGWDGELVNDRFSSNRTVWRFELLDGTWKATTGVEIKTAVGKENTFCEF